MTILKNRTISILAKNIHLFKGWSVLLGFALVGTTAGVALAPQGHTFDSTFTKWGLPRHRPRAWLRTW